MTKAISTKSPTISDLEIFIFYFFLVLDYLEILKIEMKSKFKVKKLKFDLSTNFIFLVKKNRFI